jgi:hypothetical protein
MVTVGASIPEEFEYLYFAISYGSGHGGIHRIISFTPFGRIGSLAGNNQEKQYQSVYQGHNLSFGLLSCCCINPAAKYIVFSRRVLASLLKT